MRPSPQLPTTDEGLYSRDTRYLSGYQLYINGQSWTLLNSGAIAFYASQTHLVNPRVVTEEVPLLREPWVSF